MTLPFDLLKRIELLSKSHAVLRDLKMKEAQEIIQYIFLQGAQALYEILTEVSEDEERAIEAPNKFKTSLEEMRFEQGARFGLSLGKAKKEAEIIRLKEALVMANKSLEAAWNKLECHFSGCTHKTRAVNSNSCSTHGHLLEAVINIRSILGDK